MPTTTVATRYGSEAAQALHAAVAAAKAGDPLAPVTVVVPSNHVGVATRRLLASGSLGPVASSGIGITAITFVTVYRLAELLGATRLAGARRRPISTPVLTAAMRAELAADPGLFGPVKDHPATEAALVATYRELRDCSPSALDALAGQGPRAREVVRLHRGVRTRLEPAWSDEEDLLDAATAVARAGGAAELGPIVVYLPQLVTQHGGRLLQALGEQLPTTVIVGLTGIAAADAEIARTLTRIGADPELARLHGEPELPVSADRTTITTASDADEEVRAAVRAVVAAVRAGTRLDRIAVLHASPQPYAHLAHEHLQAAGIGTNGAAVLPLSARVAGRTLLDLLALPAGDFRRQEVFAWLSSAPIRHEGRTAPTTAWERLSREAAVVRGRFDWDHHLTRLADAKDRRADDLTTGDEEPEHRATREREEAARARSLQSFVLGVIDDLASAASRPRPWSEHAAWAKRRLHQFLGHAGRRGDWPLAERKAADRVEQALDRLGALDAVEETTTLEVFTRTLEVELDNDLGRVGRFGDGVLVGSIEMGIGLDLDLVVVVGLAEGSFPATVRDDSLLPDGERRATGGELGPRADRVERQHHQLVGALASGARQLLCVPRGDLRRNAERVPSRWALDVATQIAGTGERWWADDLHGTTASWVRHVASYDAGMRAVEVPATAQEHRLVSLLASGGDLAAAADARTTLGASVISARRSGRFTRFDGNLAGLPVPSPTETLTSPTRLERWATCPHAHLLQDILKVVPIENPEEALMITALDRGSLVHEILERFLVEVLDRPAAERPDAATPWSTADHGHLVEIAEVRCDAYLARGVTGRQLYWRRDRRKILDDLGTFLLADSDHRRSTGTTPVAVELAFGFEDGVAAVDVALPDGRSLAIRGKVDRIDLSTDGSIHVVDYKTGRSDRFKKLSEENPVLGGTKMQLPIYGLAGRQHQGRRDAPVHAEYWFATDRGGFDRVGYRVTDAVLEQATTTLAEIVHGIEHGVFIPRPTPEPSTAIFVDCEFCDPDGLGVVELRRQWERKRHDPAVERYAELAEPLQRPEPEADPIEVTA